MSGYGLVAFGITLLLAADSYKHGPAHAEAALAHPANPVMQAEHTALLDLINAADATHEAVQDGPWSSKATWKNGTVPEAGAAVHIPRHRVVIVDRILEAAPTVVRVDGTLRFTPDANTQLMVDT